MSPIKALNVFVLQWFGVRLARVLNDDGQQEAWGLIGPVLPLTGWGRDYIGWPTVFMSWPV